METLLAIIQQLGINSSIFYQFTIAVVIFLLARVIFLKHLQEILDQREEKTVKQEKSNENAYNEVTKLSEEYIEKLSLEIRQNNKVLNEEKSKIISKFDEQFKKEEEQVNQFVEQEKKKIKENIDQIKTDLVKESETLSTMLVDKIIKG